MAGTKSYKGMVRKGLAREKQITLGPLRKAHIRRRLGRTSLDEAKKEKDNDSNEQVGNEGCLCDAGGSGTDAGCSEC